MLGGRTRGRALALPLLWGLGLDLGCAEQDYAFEPGPDLRRLAVGSGVACEITDAGRLHCWGRWGMSLASREFVDVVMAGDTMCALDDEGEVSCWGDVGWALPDGEYVDLEMGASGPCGLDRTGRAVCGEYVNGGPSQSQWEGAVGFSGGPSKFCGLFEDGHVECDPGTGDYCTGWNGGWGSGDEGLPGGIAPGCEPEVFAHDLSRITGHCGLTLNGRMVCTGEDAAPNSGPGFVQLAGDAGGYCLLHAEGGLTCEGEQGPLFPTLPRGRIEEVAVDGDHAKQACVRDVRGRVTCEGRDPAMYLPPGALDFTQASVDVELCGVGSDGRVRCWDRVLGSGTEAHPDRQVTTVGRNTCWLGDGGALRCTEGDEPMLGCDALPSFMDMAMDDYKVCGVTGAEELYCVFLDHGMCQSVGVVGTGYRRAVRGAKFCGVRTDGGLDCFGYPAFDLKYHVDGDFEYVDVYSTGAHQNIYCWCGIQSEGTLACGGSDEACEVATPPEGRFVDVVVYGDHGDPRTGCALDEDGMAHCWWLDTGERREGPLSGPFIDLAASGSTLCGVRSDGAVRCRGGFYR